MDNDDKIEETEVSEKSAKKGILASLRQVRFALATTIVLLSLMTISAVFVIRVWSKTETSCYEDLAMETEDAIDYLEANLRSDRTMLRVIAGLIGNADDIDSIEVGGYLANYDVNSLITQAGILLPDDELMSTKGRRSRVSSTLNFEHESLLGEHISMHAGGLDVLGGLLNGIERGIRAVYLVVELAFLAVIIVDVAP